MIIRQWDIEESEKEKKHRIGKNGFIFEKRKVKEEKAKEKA